jgi:hypothetical protein
MTLNLERLTDGLSEQPWPTKRTGLSGADRWAQARAHANRKGDFIGESNSLSAEEERDRKYRKRRLKCAMAELYVNFGIWLQGDKKTRIPENHLQAAIRAHAALKHLGADELFKIAREG